MIINVKAELTPRRGRAEQRDHNRTALIQAAHAAVIDQGYEAMQVSDIAARAGLTTGAVYSIFGSKVDLFVAVLGDIDASVSPMFDGLADLSGGAEDVLHQLTDSYLTYAADPAETRTMTFELELAALSARIPLIREACAEILQRRHEAVRTALTDRPGGADGRCLVEHEADAIARIAISALQGIVVSSLHTNWKPPREPILAALRGAVHAIMNPA